MRGNDVAREKKLEANTSDEIRTGMGGGRIVFILSGRSRSDHGWSGWGYPDEQDRTEP
jgi:hypothetical protein